MKKWLICFNSKFIISLILAALIFSALFLTEYKVYAYFSESTFENVGLQVNLGTVELTVKPNSSETINNPIIIESEENIIELNKNVKNDGTLIGNLAYKITLLDYQDNRLDSSFIEMEVNNSKVTVGDKYQLLVDEYKRPVIMSPQESRDVIIEIYPSSLQSPIGKFKLQIEFFLFQENGTIEKPLFHDKEKVVYEFQLKENNFDDITTKKEESNIADVAKFNNKTILNDEPEFVKSVQENGVEESPVKNGDFNGINRIPEDELFNYSKITLINNYYVGMIQEQVDWLMSFGSMQEFSDHLTNNTTAIYMKYDKISGIEDVENIVYQLVEANQLDFEVSLKDIPERKMLEIKFIK